MVRFGGPQGGIRLPGLLLVACLLGSGASATPAGADDLQFPTQDDAIVEHLPTHVGDAAQRRAARAAERAQRTELRQHPNELGLALKAANDALARGRLRGDPRELGVAEAALAPWWNLPDPPPAVRLVRATVHQSQHDFRNALVDLDTLLDNRPDLPLPLRAQGELTRSGVHQVLGEFAAAEAGCRRLAGAEFFDLGAAARLPAQACLAELSSLQGRADTAAVVLARLAGATDPASPASVTGDLAPGWLNLMRAELAERRGDPAAGPLFAAALKANGDVYTQCAYADWLLGQRRPAEVLTLLKGSEAADPVLLRLALALRATRGARDRATLEATTTLGDRYDAALLRGDKSHGREQSRYELDLRGDTRAALLLAQSNWSVQHEPADQVVLVRAAHAARRDAAAAPVWQFLRDTGGRDVRLAAGGPAAMPYLPVAFGSASAAVPAAPAASADAAHAALAALVASRRAAAMAAAASGGTPPPTDAPSTADPAAAANPPARSSR